MKDRTLTRAGFLGTAAAALLAAAGPAYASRDEGAEQYVQAQAAEALSALGNSTVGGQQRRQTFYNLMARLADMQRIANYVLGRYAMQLQADQALRTRWLSVFQDYSIAVYEDRLERYSTSRLSVTGSIERTPGRDVIVLSEMTPRGGARALPVRWRMLKSGDIWKVVDVSLIIDGNEIWLAQQQQRDFLAVLDRNNGSIPALITEVQRMTTNMRSRVGNG